MSIQATGLDDPFVSGGTDYGRVRRPFPVEKALDDALLAWGINGEDLLPDHGYPLRLVLPGWVGIASIKWLGSLEVSTTQLTSPWNTTFYRMVGPDWPADSPPLTVNPVRSAWELARDQVLPSRPVTLTGRSWSGAGRITRVSVSLDGGARWRPAVLDRRSREDEGWTQWSVRWGNPRPGRPRAARPRDRRAGPHPAARGRLQHPGLLLRRRRAPPRAGRLSRLRGRGDRQAITPTACGAKPGKTCATETPKRRVTTSVSTLR